MSGRRCPVSAATKAYQRGERSSTFPITQESITEGDPPRLVIRYRERDNGAARSAVLSSRANGTLGVLTSATEEHQHHHESLKDKLFHHKKEGEDGGGSGSAGSTAQGEGSKEKKGEGEMKKFENYIKEDEKQEEEGGEYGGLM